MGRSGDDRVSSQRQQSERDVKRTVSEEFACALGLALSARQQCLAGERRTEGAIEAGVQLYRQRRLSEDVNHGDLRSLERITKDTQTGETSMPRRNAGKFPEMGRRAGEYPWPCAYGTLLAWHLDNGTRPLGSPDQQGDKWERKDLAKAIGCAPRTVGYWVHGKTQPSVPKVIARVLFGDNPAYQTYRDHLDRAWDDFRVELSPSLPRAGGFPPPPNPLLGRADDIRTVLPFLRPGKAVLVQGGPGMGKSSLACAVGADPEAVRRFGALRRWFVRLDSVTSAGELEREITITIGIAPDWGFRNVLNRLALGPCLLVLDNFETLWEIASERQSIEAVLGSLAGIPELGLLVTFRGSSRIGGAPWALEHVVKPLDSTTAGNLFLGIAGNHFVGDPLLPDFMSELGGIPLAVNLVAKRARGRENLIDLWNQYQNIGADLVRQPDASEDRQTSLPASIELSLASRRATESAKQLFGLLGALPAGLHLRDRDAILGDQGFAAAEALLQLELASERGGRLDVLPPIRRHARKHRSLDARAAPVWTGHYISLLQSVGSGIGTSMGDHAVSRLSAEFPNIEEAMAVAAELGRHEETAAALEPFWRLAVAAAVPTKVLLRLARIFKDAGDFVSLARCLRFNADIALRRSDIAAARHDYQQARAYFAKADDQAGIGHCEKGLGDVEVQDNCHEAARAAFRRALEIFEKLGDHHAKGDCILSMGFLDLREWSNEEAWQHFSDALPLYAESEDLAGQAECQLGQGDILLRRGKYEEASQCFGQAISLAKRSGFRRIETNCIARQADALYLRGRNSEAEPLYLAAYRRFAALGNMLGQAACMLRLGDLALARDDESGACRAYRAARPLYGASGSVAGEAVCLQRFGDILARHARRRSAARLFYRADGLFAKINSRRGRADCTVRLADLTADQNKREAKSLYRAALKEYERIGFPLGISQVSERIERLGRR
jgi:tetratricopeptide (TPR) repeat protein